MSSYEVQGEEALRSSPALYAGLSSCSTPTVCGGAGGTECRPLPSSPVGDELVITPCEAQGVKQRISLTLNCVAVQQKESQKKIALPLDKG